MNSQPERVHQGAAGALEPVGPSLIVRIVMRPMTKMLNPLIVKLAGRRHFRMAAQIRHVGRRSGRTYTTPVSARRSGDLVADRAHLRQSVRLVAECALGRRRHDPDRG